MAHHGYDNTMYGNFADHAQQTSLTLDSWPFVHVDDNYVCYRDCCDYMRYSIELILPLSALTLNGASFPGPNQAHDLSALIYGDDFMYNFGGNKGNQFVKSDKYYCNT